MSRSNHQRARADEGFSLLSPWSALAPWFVILIGVIVGGWLGYTPHLFVAIAALCLVVGLLKMPRSL